MEKRKCRVWTGGILTAFILAMSLSFWTSHSRPHAYDYGEAAQDLAFWDRTSYQSGSNDDPAQFWDDAASLADALAGQKVFHGNGIDGEAVIASYSAKGVESGNAIQDEVTTSAGLKVAGKDDEIEGEVATIPVSEMSAAHILISRLELQRFRDNIRTLNDFGDRCRMSSCPNSPPYSYEYAQNWIEEQLQEVGYTVYRHTFTTSAGSRSNLYVTKAGSLHPDQMYIVSAHLDGRGGGGAADDNASGCSLVLEMARIFAAPDVVTDVSLRFIWWDQEEEGIAGSRAYVRDRNSLRGSPEEPDWLGMITYDMILYDHGVPPQPEQIAEADLDIEYRAGTRYADQAAYLANSMASGASLYADYPAEVNGASTWTDDASFWDYCPAFSVRENRRTTEIGIINGQPRIHPFYHTDQDVYEAYTDLDYVFGFSAVKLTAGTPADWTRARIVSGTDPPATHPSQ